MHATSCMRKYDLVMWLQEERQIQGAEHAMIASLLWKDRTWDLHPVWPNIMMRGHMTERLCPHTIDTQGWSSLRCMGAIAVTGGIWVVWNQFDNLSCNELQNWSLENIALPISLHCVIHLAHDWVKAVLLVFTNRIWYATCALYAHWALRAQ